VHDIPTLSSLSAWTGIAHDDDQNDSTTLHNGWIACTSDELLSTKTQLSDVRVKFKNTAKPNPEKGAWPTIAQSATGTAETPILATPRDLKRWEMLVEHLSSRMNNTLSADDHEANNSSGYTDNDDDDGAHLLGPSAANTITTPRSTPHTNTSIILEPLSWSASLAQYSARSGLDAERMHDCDDAVLSAAITACGDDAPDMSDSETTSPTAEAGFVQAYFRECTRRVFDVLKARIDEGDAASVPYHDEVEDETDDETAPTSGRSEPDTVASAESEGEVVMTREDMIDMGLDVWSANDVNFVREMGRLWFGRRIGVKAGEVEVCGVRVW